MGLMESQIDGKTRTLDHAARALDGLRSIAKRILTLTNPEGELVGEITSILHDCMQVHRTFAVANLSYDHEHWDSMLYIGLWAHACLGVFSTRGCRFTLYTPGVRLNDATVIYPRKWYREVGTTELLEKCARAMVGLLCKVLSTTNIVIYISNDELSRYPPWKSDDFLSERLANSSIPSSPRSHYGGFNHNLLPAHARNSQKQLEVQDTFAKSRATVTYQDEPSKSIQTSEPKEIPFSTGLVGADAMYTDWASWDMLFLAHKTDNHFPAPGRRSSKYKIRNMICFNRDPRL